MHWGGRADLNIVNGPAVEWFMLVPLFTSQRALSQHNTFSSRPCFLSGKNRCRKRGQGKGVGEMQSLQLGRGCLKSV